MKKIAALLAVVAVLFCGLWMHEIFDRSDTEELCQNYAKGTHSALELYEKLKDQNKGSPAEFANYWSAVSRFYAFSETLRLLVGSEDGFYRTCKSLHNHMLLNPENVVSHMNELLVAMNILSENYADGEAHKIISDLDYLFQYGTYPK